MDSSTTLRKISSRAIGARHQDGVTLIEILVTLLVLAVGLLGLAALQGLSLQTGQVSYQRTQAVNIAYEVADFARANRSHSDAWIKGQSETLGQSLALQHLPAGTATVTVGNDRRIDVTVSWSEQRLEDLEDEAAQQVSISTRI